MTYFIIIFTKLFKKKFRLGLRYSQVYFSILKYIYIIHTTCGQPVLTSSPGCSAMSPSRVLSASSSADRVPGGGPTSGPGPLVELTSLAKCIFLWRTMILDYDKLVVNTRFRLLNNRVVGDYFILVLQRDAFLPTTVDIVRASSICYESCEKKIIKIFFLL